MDVASENNIDMTTWMNSKFSLMGKEAMELLLSIQWVLWQSRNNLVFQGKNISQVEVVDQAIYLLHSYQAETSRPSTSKKREMRSKPWEAPHRGQIKMNTDAAVSPNVGVGFGVVFRNEQGHVMLSALRREDSTADEAEARAIRFGLQTAINEGIRQVVVESDCLKVITTRKKNEEDRSRSGLLINDIKELSKQCSILEFSHIYREAKQVAHALANVALTIVSDCILLNKVPEEVEPLITFDVPNLSV